jgi:acyl-CoA reductase-like NAD-dependent aldehyde dehydrogenase
MSITLPAYDRLYVGGEWIAPLTGETIEVVNPTTEDVIGRIPAAGAADVDQAVAAARAAFGGWAATPATDRAAFLTAIAEQLSERGDALAATIAAELGMPVGLARLIQVGLPTMTFASTAALLEDELSSEVIGNSLVVREPLGVVAAITPWNYPLHQIAAKVAPALAAGCTVVLKPSEITPLCAFALAEICDAVGLPAGVLNLVTGTGPAVGEALTGHPGVDLVTFTGSEAVGRRIGEVTGRNLVPSALELGGKSACIVLDDADLELAVTSCVTRCMINSGQTCIALTRLLVPRERLAEAETIAAAVAQAHIAGDPFDPATLIGPLVSAVQRDRVREHIRGAVREGARIVTGGAEAPAGLDRGYFVSPTVLSDVSSDMTVAQEEIFGPVLSILAYEGEEDAIRIANDSRFGLSGAVWAADEARALRVARRLRTGQVDVNGGVFNPCAPFGGVGCSGSGRELGAHGLREFLFIKSIQL